MVWVCWRPRSDIRTCPHFHACPHFSNPDGEGRCARHPPRVTGTHGCRALPPLDTTSFSYPCPHAYTCPHFCTSMQRGGALVIRRLCGHMGAERVFTELSQILDQEEDLAFASTLVQASVGCWCCSHLCEGGVVVTGVRVGGCWSAATGDAGHLRSTLNPSHSHTSHSHTSHSHTSLCPLALTFPLRSAHPHRL